MDSCSDIGTICLTCGGEDSTSLVYCMRCCIYAIHRYCFYKLPTPEEFVRWVCDDCKEKVPNESTLQNTSPGKHQAMHDGKLIKKRDAGCLDTGNEDNKQENILVKDGLMVPVINETNSIPSCTKKQKEVMEIDSGSDSSEKVPVNNFDNRGAQPVNDPIWRGNFSIRNEKYNTVDGFVAHLSNQSCKSPQVLAAASALPSLLRLEMLPKSQIWPKTFQKMDPSDCHIGLYFFPEEKRYERVFDHMVDDLMCHEHALRASLGDAELLIFTSIELPLLHWRVQGKYYLWGVFRGKQASLLPHPVGKDRSLGSNFVIAPKNMANGEKRDLIDNITKVGMR